VAVRKHKVRVMGTSRFPDDVLHQKFVLVRPYRADPQLSVGDSVSLLREPDALVAHVRFDERHVETEQGAASEAPAERKGRQQIGYTYNHRATSRLYQFR
jgi:hypothetical protein